MGKEGNFKAAGIRYTTAAQVGAGKAVREISNPNRNRHRAIEGHLLDIRQSNPSSSEQ
jgi:hypothetical protein